MTASALGSAAVRGARALVRGAVAALFRERCAGCREWGLAALCDGCRRGWPAAPASPAPAGVDAVLAATAHDGPARRAIAALKFHARPRLARPLGEAMAAVTGLPGAGWVLVPAPLALGRRRARGYNQAKLLARAVARRTGHPVHDVLRRRGGAGPQMRLGRAARLRNVTGTVSCPVRLDGARILLVDDVLTTGATAAACAGALRAAGAAEIVLLVATRAAAPSPLRGEVRRRRGAG